MDRREHRPLLGVFLRFSSVSLFGIMSAGAKHIGAAIPVGEVIAARGAVGVAAIVLIAWRMRNFQLLRTANWRSQALRSSMGTLAMLCWFLALNGAPIADATAMIYVGPIFGTLLAATLLRERMRANRWLAVALGFGGALIMMSPRLGHADATTGGLVFALLCALFSALSSISLRLISRTEHALTTTFYFSLVSLAGATLTGSWNWPAPNAEQCAYLLFIGLLGTAAQFLMTAAFRYAEASMIAPTEYTGIITATLLGYFFFDEIPGTSIWLGVPLVIAAGLLIVWSQYPPAITPRTKNDESRVCASRTPGR